LDSRVNRPLEWRAGLGSERYAKILALQGAPFGLARTNISLILRSVSEEENEFCRVEHRNIFVDVTNDGN
jgi:hypothetical protein